MGKLHHGLVFHRVQVLLLCQEATPVAAQQPGKLEAVDRVATQLATFGMPPGFLDSGFLAMGAQHRQ